MPRPISPPPHPGALLIPQVHRLHARFCEDVRCDPWGAERSHECAGGRTKWGLAGTRAGVGPGVELGYVVEWRSHFARGARDHATTATAAPAASY